jgi:hypothetical protein
MFVVAARCTVPGGVCFCASTGGGPAAGSGYDLALTEQLDAEGHRFVVEVGSAEGAWVLAAVPQRDPREGEVAAARDAVAQAADRMGRAMPPVDLPDLLRDARESSTPTDSASWPTAIPYSGTRSRCESPRPSWTGCRPPEPGCSTCTGATVADRDPMLPVPHLVVDCRVETRDAVTLRCPDAPPGSLHRLDPALLT